MKPVAWEMMMHNGGADRTMRLLTTGFAALFTALAAIALTATPDQAAAQDAGAAARPDAAAETVGVIVDRNEAPSPAQPADIIQADETLPPEPVDDAAAATAEAEAAQQAAEAEAQRRAADLEQQKAEAEAEAARQRADREAAEKRRAEDAERKARAEAEAERRRAEAAAERREAQRSRAQTFAVRLKAKGFGRPSRSRVTNDADDRKALAAFYAAENTLPLWTDANGPTAAARDLARVLTTADEWGLDPDAFRFALEDDGGPLNDEIALSLAALKYARFARGGRIANPTDDLSSYLDRKPQLMAAADVLKALAGQGDIAATLTGLHPQHDGFQRLRTALKRLRAGKAEAEEKVQIPASGPLLSQGKTHPHVALVRERLGVAIPQNEDGSPGNPAYFDASLSAALKAFQKQNGLSADGVVGRRTRAAFNGGPRAVSEAMLIANMEMWRWMPDDLGDLYVMVNLPEYKVRVYQNGRIIHEERIITGKTDKQTPVFSDVMETIVFNPKWGVPNSIKVNELLPSLARGGNYFQRQNLRLTYRGRQVDPRSVNWAQADIRNYHVYQPPGPGNVLGVVKFRFPNKHQVYMHDTPTKSLFNKRRRTYSHGCMRVRNPMRLAEVLLKADRSWSAGRVGSMVGGSQEKTVALNRNVPVHVIYQTAVVDTDGDVATFGDVYQHEKRVRLALAGAWSQIPRHRDHMIPVKIDRRKIDRIVRNSGNYGNDPMNDFFQSIFGF